MKKQEARKVEVMTRSEKAKGDCRLKVTTKTKQASDQARKIGKRRKTTDGHFCDGDSNRNEEATHSCSTFSSPTRGRGKVAKERRKTTNGNFCDGDNKDKEEAKEEQKKQTSA